MMGLLLCPEESRFLFTDKKTENGFLLSQESRRGNMVFQLAEALWGVLP